MRLRSFDYFAAGSLADALVQLARYGSDARVLAGGTDLVPAMKHKSMRPRMVVSLHRVSELKFISDEGAVIRLGSLVRHTDLADNSELNGSFPVLCEAVSLIGSWQIRNVATIGGNLCNASPAADSAAPLLALDARVKIVDANSEREMPVSAFFIGPGETALRSNQILKEIVIEKPKNRSAGCYLKLMRKKAVDLSLVGVAFQAETDEAGEKLVRAAIGLGGVAPTPIRAPEAEAMLTGLPCEEAMKMLPRVAKTAVAATSPISDVRATAEYRKEIVEVYVRRAGEKAINILSTKKGIQT
jgi:carbon-monoxide dehydrogenase medium subunit